MKVLKNSLNRNRKTLERLHVRKTPEEVKLSSFFLLAAISVSNPLCPALVLPLKATAGITSLHLRSAPVVGQLELVAL